MRWLFYIGLAVAVWWVFFRRREAGSRKAGATQVLRRFKVLPGGSGPMPSTLSGEDGPIMFPKPEPVPST